MALYLLKYPQAPQYVIFSFTISLLSLSLLSRAVLGFLGEETEAGEHDGMEGGREGWRDGQGAWTLFLTVGTATVSLWLLASRFSLLASLSCEMRR